MMDIRPLALEKGAELAGGIAGEFFKALGKMVGTAVTGEPADSPDGKRGFLQQAARLLKTQAQTVFFGGIADIILKNSNQIIF